MWTFSGLRPETCYKSKSFTVEPKVRIKYHQIFDEQSDHRSGDSRVGRRLTVRQTIATTPVDDYDVAVVGHKELVLHVSHPRTEQLVVEEAMDYEFGRFFTIKVGVLNRVVVSDL